MSGDKFEPGPIIKVPGDRHLNQRGGLSEFIGFGWRPLISNSAPVWFDIISHQAAFILKSMIHEKLNGIWAVIPGRRAIPAGRDYLHDLQKHINPLLKDTLFFLIGKIDRVFMYPTVVPDLMTCLRIASTERRICDRSCPRDEECGLALNSERSARTRRTPIGPNSPRETMLGEVSPQGANPIGIGIKIKRQCDFHMWYRMSAI